MKRGVRLIAAILGGFFLTFIFVALFSKPSTELITVNEKKIFVRVADTPIERYMGLSGIEEERMSGEGMLFVYSKPKERVFSMRGMKFPLDFVWIRNGVVVSVDADIAPPKDGEEPMLISSTPLSADMILEFPAGFAKANDIFIGTVIKYDN